MLTYRVQYLTKFNITTKFVSSVIQSPMLKFNQENYALNKDQTFAII